MGLDPSSIGDDNSFILENLVTLSGVSSYTCTPGILSRIPNLTKIGIRIESADLVFDFLYDFASLYREFLSFKCVVVNNPVRSGYLEIFPVGVWISMGVLHEGDSRIVWDQLWRWNKLVAAREFEYCIRSGDIGGILVCCVGEWWLFLFSGAYMHVCMYVCMNTSQRNRGLLHLYFLRPLFFSLYFSPFLWFKRKSNNKYCC